MQHLIELYNSKGQKPESYQERKARIMKLTDMAQIYVLTNETRKVIECINRINRSESTPLKISERGIKAKKDNSK